MSKNIYEIAAPLDELRDSCSELRDDLVRLEDALMEVAPDKRWVTNLLVELNSRVRDLKTKLSDVECDTRAEFEL